jgi:hypothetical protein
MQVLEDADLADLVGLGKFVGCLPGFVGCDQFRDGLR